MKTNKIAMVILAIALALYILIPGLSWAEDGAALQTVGHNFDLPVPRVSRNDARIVAHNRAGLEKRETLRQARACAGARQLTGTEINETPEDGNW